MPIEVRELVIRVNLENQDQKQPATKTEITTDRESLVADCVELVLDILRQKGER